MAPQTVIGTDVSLGRGVSVGPYCLVGIDGPDAPTVIGQDAVLRTHVVIYRGVTVGVGFHAGHHVLVREATSIGHNVSIGSGSMVEHDVEIHDRVRMHSQCFVPEHSVLEEGAWLGPGVILTNARYPNRPDTKASLKGPRVCVGAVLGAGCVVLSGVVVGKGALVGAGAVVTHDIEPGATVVGNPARIL